MKSKVAVMESLLKIDGAKGNRDIPLGNKI